MDSNGKEERREGMGLTGAETEAEDEEEEEKQEGEEEEKNPREGRSARRWLQDSAAMSIFPRAVYFVLVALFFFFLLLLLRLPSSSSSSSSVLCSVSSFPNCKTCPSHHFTTLTLNATTVRV
jgi:hypothetical protein